MDRIKELIISAAGKSMSPANIEATIKSAGSAVGAVCERRRAPLQRRAPHVRSGGLAATVADPTMKLKRKPIAEKYAAEIDALYA